MKLAQRLARRIEDEIIEKRLPPEALLGSEPELLERYGVSRSVLREAIRLLEHDGIAVMRKGHSGGLFVTQPDVDAVVHALALRLRYARTTTQELYRLRNVLEPQVAYWAAERSDPAGIDTLQTLLAEEEAATLEERFDDFNACVLEFHAVIGDLAGNLPAAIFSRSLAVMTGVLGRSPTYPRAVLEESHWAHVKIAESIMAGDPVRASYRMVRHLQASATHSAAQESED